MPGPPSPGRPTPWERGDRSVCPVCGLAFAGCPHTVRDGDARVAQDRLLAAVARHRRPRRRTTRPPKE